MNPYALPTPEQDLLRELYRCSAEVRDFCDEQYPGWQNDPEAALEALTELGDMGGAGA